MIILIYIFVFRDLPSPTSLADTSIPQSTQIYDRNDMLLYTIYGKRNQSIIPLTKIPKTIQQATIAIEDKNFYSHGFVDLTGIARAFISTVFHKQVQGGSTLTQQLVKNTLLTSEQTVIRKIKEAILSFATETLYSKDQILSMYLNQIPYGGTAYGIEAASETYFGKHASQLSLGESALLAGLPEAPSVFSPFGSHPELAKERQLLVLKAMLNQKNITKKQYDDAVKEPLNYEKFSSNIKAPHFVMYVKDVLTQKYGERMVEQGGLIVRTSLDSKIQDFAQETVASEVAKLKPYRVSNGAAMITKPGTGEILAMVGSKDYFAQDIDGNFNVTIALRQPGSSIKPINYATGLVKGYTAATPFIDQPFCVPPNDPKGYCPHNYDGGYHGVQSMRYSLGNSFNIPAVKMLKLNGLDAMIATASAMGITTFGDAEKAGLTLTLGGQEVHMTDMATVYGVFANGGYRVDLHPILKVTDHTGKTLEEYKPLPSPIFGTKVLPQGVAYIMSDMLADNNARTADFGSNSELYVPKKIVSVKTGTTNDFKDNWTIGYTPSFVVATWVGNNDGTTMSNIASGITGAAPIWHDLMVNLLKDKPEEPPQRPSTVIQKAVCSDSGLLPQKDTPSCNIRNEYFIKGTEPKDVDPGMQNTWIDKTAQDLPKTGQTDNLEAKPERVITDPTGDRYCITCNHPSPTPTPQPGH